MATQIATDTATGRRGAPTTSRRLKGQGRTAFWFLLPFMALYIAFIIGPTFYALILSFTNSSLVQTGLGGWAGFGNYAEAFADPQFWDGLWNTIRFTLFTTVPLVVLALLFALLAQRVRRGQWFFRFAFFAPYVLPSAVMALIWIWIYTPAIGLAANYLERIGITPPNWLGDPQWAMISVAAATVWWTLGFNFVLYLAGLQEIPRQLYEAASIDGAGPIRQIFSVTLPMLGRTTTLVAVLQVIASLKVFDQIFIMTAGGPNFSTRPALQYIYDVSFTNYRIGYGAAVSMLLFLVILVVSFVWLAIVQRQQKEVD
jgi:multiple sugar transport system permease protein